MALSIKQANVELGAGVLQLAVWLPPSLNAPRLAEKTVGTLYVLE